MPVDHVIPFFSLTSCVLLCLAAPWHLKAGNLSVIALIAWLLVANFVIMLNAFIWWDNVSVSGAIWCDITAKLQPAWAMGIPCANLCLARRLEAIASTRAVSLPAHKQRLSKYIELVVAVLVPLIYAALAVVYQGHRYDILEGVGCLPSVYVSTPYIILGVLPPIVAFLINLIYSVLCIRHFFIRQKQFHAVLSSSGSKMNKGRYLRMLSLCMVEVVINLPILVTVQLLTIPAYKAAFAPYISWDNVHYGFNAVVTYTSSLFDTPGGHQAFVSQTLSRWVAPISSFLVFFFFGLNEDAIVEYKNISRFLRSRSSTLQVDAKRTPASNSRDVPHEMPRLCMNDLPRSTTFASDAKYSPQSEYMRKDDDVILRGVDVQVETMIV